MKKGFVNGKNSSSKEDYQNKEIVKIYICLSSILLVSFFFTTLFWLSSREAINMLGSSCYISNYIMIGSIILFWKKKIADWELLNIISGYFLINFLFLAIFYIPASKKLTETQKIFWEALNILIHLLPLILLKLKLRQTSFKERIISPSFLILIWICGIFIIENYYQALKHNYLKNFLIFPPGIWYLFCTQALILIIYLLAWACSPSSSSLIKQKRKTEI